MTALPSHELRVYRNADLLPSEAETLFESQLAHSRRASAAHSEDADPWRFALICAATPTDHVLGGVLLDIGPIGGTGPIAAQRLAYLERTFVRPEYRRRGLATRLLRRAIQAASEATCEYIRCSNDWDNAAETRLFLRCGFALVDLNGEEEEEACYLAVRPLRHLES